MRFILTEYRPVGAMMDQFMKVFIQNNTCYGRVHFTKESTKGGGRRPPPLYYGGWGGGKHSKNIQTYEQICIEYVFSCIYLPYPFKVPIILIFLASLPCLNISANLS